DVAERAGESPAGHVPLALPGCEIHQGRLREADEGSHGGIPDQERNQERPEPRRARRESRRHREPAAADDEQGPSPRGVSRSADERVERAADETRNREDETDLGVRQREIVADQRQGRRARAADELVEQLDREEKRNGAAEAAASVLAGSA